MPSAELIKAIRAEYSLPWRGIHGIAHWARVLENGLRLATLTGARLDVVRLFAVFHDSKRINEGHDPNHGHRGAAFAARLRGTLFRISDEDFELLRLACEDHTEGKTAADVTIQTCWDADRLDLGRVGMLLDRKHLCTQAARSPAMIAWAYERGVSNVVPAMVTTDWEC